MATNYLINLYKKDKFPAVVFKLYQTYGPYQDENRLIPFVIIKSSIKNLDFPCSTEINLEILFTLKILLIVFF